MIKLIFTRKVFNIFKIVLMIPSIPRYVENNNVCYNCASFVHVSCINDWYFFNELQQNKNNFIIL